MDEYEGSYLRSVRKNLGELAERSSGDNPLYAGLLVEAVLLLAAIADELHAMNERERW